MNTALYFLALLPPENVCREITEFKREIAEKFESKKALRSPPHITLIAPFRTNRELEEPVSRFLNGFSKTIKSFEIRLKGFGCFENRRRRSPVIFVNPILSNAMEHLYKNIQDKMSSNFSFVTRDTRTEFHPHITIAYKDLSLEKFDLAWPLFKDRIYERTFICENLTLLKYNTGKTGWDIYIDYNFNPNISN